jgi:hypothetical protein
MSIGNDQANRSKSTEEFMKLLDTNQENQKHLYEIKQEINDIDLKESKIKDLIMSHIDQIIKLKQQNQMIMDSYKHIITDLIRQK